MILALAAAIAAQAPAAVCPDLVTPQAFVCRALQSSKAGDPEAAARSYWSRAAAADPNGKSGQAAREALALLSKPANVQSEPAPTK